MSATLVFHKYISALQVIVKLQFIVGNLSSIFSTNYLQTSAHVFALMETLDTYIMILRC